MQDIVYIRIFKYVFEAKFSILNKIYINMKWRAAQIIGYGMIYFDFQTTLGNQLLKVCGFVGKYETNEKKTS